MKGDNNMITIEEAIKIFKKNAPNKRIITINDWNNKYVFESRDKKLKDEDDNWDCGCEVVDKNTGDFSTMNGFDMDYIMNAKTLFKFD